MKQRTNGIKAIIIVSVFTFISFALATIFFMLAGDESFGEQSREYSKILFEKMGLEDIKTMEISVYNTDIALLPSKDGKLGVSANLRSLFKENERINFTMSDSHLKLGISKENKNSTLTIQVSERKELLEIFVPDNIIETLSIESKSGDINAHKIKLGELSIDTKSGDLHIKDFTTGNFKLITKSGSASISNAEVNSFNLDTKSGDIKLEKLVIKDKLQLESVSGEYQISGLLAREIKISSTSGDINLKNTPTAETLVIKTVSGRTNASISSILKNLKIKSVSGDIDLKLHKEQKAALKFSTVSGELFKKHPLVSKSKNAQAEETPNFDISTVSGDVNIGSLDK